MEPNDQVIMGDDDEAMQYHSITRVPQDLISTLNSKTVVSAKKETPALFSSPMRKVKIEIHSRIS